MTFDITEAAIVTAPKELPPYSLYGYLIVPDGTTYTLLRKWWHGAVLALLYPDTAKDAGYVIPDTPEEVDVYSFQQFELDNHCHFPVIRVCPGRMLGPMSIDRGSEKSTPEQIAAVRQIIKVLGMTANDKVATDHMDMKVSRMWEFLLSDEDVHGGPRFVAKHRVIRDGEDKDAVLEAEDSGWYERQFEEFYGI